MLSIDALRPQYNSTNCFLNTRYEKHKCTKNYSILTLKIECFFLTQIIIFSFNEREAKKLHKIDIYKLHFYFLIFLMRFTLMIL